MSATHIAAILVGVVAAGCLPTRTTRTTPAPPQADHSAETQELIERVARLELGIRRHRELAAKREKGLTGDLERILAGIAKLATPPKPATPTVRLLPGVVYSLPIDGVPFDGPKHAAVTLVVATDFGCPFCESLQSTLDALRLEYKDELKVAYASLITTRDVGRAAALVHCAANRQGLGPVVRTELWREQRVGSGQGDLATRFALAKLTELAISLGANRSRLEGRPRFSLSCAGRPRNRPVREVERRWRADGIRQRPRCDGPSAHRDLPRHRR